MARRVISEAIWQAHRALYGRDQRPPAPTPAQAPLPVGRVVAFTIPLPPSVNALYQSPTPEMVASGTNPKAKWLTDEQRGFRNDVVGIARLVLRDDPPMLGRLQVWITLHFANRRRTDIDGRIKAALDALTHAHAYGDDGQIDKLTVERIVDPTIPEHCKIEIREIH